MRLSIELIFSNDLDDNVYFAIQSILTKARLNNIISTYTMERTYEELMIEIIIDRLPSTILLLVDGLREHLSSNPCVLNYSMETSIIPYPVTTSTINWG